jgi:hypothetical protein
MRLLPLFLTALFMLAASPATTNASQGGAAALVRPAPKSTWAPDKKNPYSKLFVLTRQPSTQAAPPPAPAGVAGKPEIKCGMLVTPADPSIDPKIAVSRPPDGTRFTIRAIEPSICR